MARTRGPARPAISKPAPWTVAKRIAAKRCLQCGGSFEPRKPDHRYCSILCWNRRLGPTRMRAVPDDFEETFVRIGRLVCEEHYGTHWRTINRWLDECGKARLIQLRRDFVMARYRTEREKRAARQKRELGAALSDDGQDGVGSA